jgi:hypothetical protein
MVPSATARHLVYGMGLPLPGRASIFSPIPWSAGGKRSAVELAAFSDSVVKYFHVASLKQVGTWQIKTSSVIGTMVLEATFSACSSQR